MQLPARLGETEMTVRDFVSLEVGDVIVMDMSCDAPIEIRLGEGPGALRGYLGSDSGVAALQMIRTQARA